MAKKKTYKITSPNPAYNGMSAQVQFAGGVAQTDNAESVEWFEQHGYTVEVIEAKEEKQVPPAPPVVPVTPVNLVDTNAPKP